MKARNCGDCANMVISLKDILDNKRGKLKGTDIKFNFAGARARCRQGYFQNKLTNKDRLFKIGQYLKKDTYGYELWRQANTCMDFVSTDE